MSSIYAYILLPQRTHIASGKLSYSVPAELVPKLKKGDLVHVPFGKRTILGIVLEITSRKPEVVTRDILEIRKPQLLTSW